VQVNLLSLAYGGVLFELTFLKGDGVSKELLLQRDQAVFLWSEQSFCFALRHNARNITCTAQFTLKEAGSVVT